MKSAEHNVVRLALRSGAHINQFLNDLLRQHKKYYPESILRRVFIAAAVAIFPSFVCFALGSFLLG